ncbi:dihydrodipicolinate synthase family protein [Jiangella aurantiaca]|nr:dihydrodipicolinate synthase family protein [Jiangella aurantiaca]
MTLLTAVFTPFGPDGSLDLDVVVDQADAISHWGSRGVYVGGTAGEGASMTTAERMALLERWCEVAAGRFDVIAHVGHTSLAEARDLAAHARHAGAHAISAVPPYFHRPADAAAVADFFARVTQARCARAPRGRAEPMTVRPNVLVIQADQFRWNCTGAAANPDVETPM